MRLTCLAFWHLPGSRLCLKSQRTLPLPSGFENVVNAGQEESRSPTFGTAMVVVKKSARLVMKIHRRILTLCLACRAAGSLSVVNAGYSDS